MEKVEEDQFHIPRVEAYLSSESDKEEVEVIKVRRLKDPDLFDWNKYNSEDDPNGSYHNYNLEIE